MTLLAVSPNFAADQTLMGGKWISSVYNIVRSTDGGETWQPVWANPPQDLAVRFSPEFANDQTVYIASSHVDQGGVWRSTNGGATWNPGQQLLTPVLSGNVNYGVEVLVPSPQFATDHTLWAVTHNQMVFDGGSYTPYSGYLYRSQNGGDTWQAFGQAAYDGSDYNLLDVKPSPNYAADHTLWAVSEIPDSLPDEGLLWTSTDFGATWQRLPEQPPLWHSSAADFPDLLVFSPTYSSDHTLYFSSEAGVYRSPDNGASWQPFGSFTSFYDWWSYIAPSPTYARDHLVFVTVAEGLYWTDDSGATWTYAELSALDGHALALSPDYETDQTLWAGLGHAGVFASANGGDTWAPTGLHNSEQVFDVAVSPDFASDQTLFAATAGGVYRATDGGTDFLTVTLGLTDTNVTNLEVSPGFASDHTLLAGTYGGLFYSSDAGDHWALGAGMPDFWRLVEDLALSPAFDTDHTAYAVFRYSGVYRTMDAGLTWQPLGLNGFDASVPVALSIALSPDFVSDHTVWVGTQNHGVYVSTNSGANWAPASQVLDDCQPILVSGSGADQQVWVGASLPGSQPGLYHFTGSSTWDQASPGLFNWDVLALAFDPADEALFAGVAADGVWRARPLPFSPRSGTITPAEGGSLAAWDGSLEISFPPAAVSADTELVLTAAQTDSGPGGGRVVLDGVELRASQGNTPVTTFSEPFTLVFHYSDAALGPYAESGLRIYTSNGASWTELVVTRDPSANTVTTQADHFSRFVLTADGSRLYFPLTRR